MSGSGGSADLSSGDAASFLASSPFGPLITQAGVDPNTLLASLSGGNNFSALIGLGGANNPFGNTTTSTGGIPADSSGGSSDYVSASDVTSSVYAQITADGGTDPTDDRSHDLKVGRVWAGGMLVMLPAFLYLRASTPGQNSSPSMEGQFLEQPVAAAVTPGFSNPATTSARPSGKLRRAAWTRAVVASGSSSMLSNAKSASA